MKIESKRFVKLLYVIMMTHRYDTVTSRYNVRLIIHLMVVIPIINSHEQIS